MKVCVFWLLVALLLHSSTVTTAQSASCAANAQRNAEGECVCNAGFEGKGNLCCVPDDHKLCMVEGDPVMYTMNGDLLPIDLPCPTLIAEVHTIGDVYDETVHAYAAGEYAQNGILKFNSMRLEYRERYNDIHTEVDIYNDGITINGKVQNRSEPWSSEGYEVEIRYDPTTNTYTMTSMGTTIIHFKPPNKETDEQETIPGLCVAVAQFSLLYDVGMCNQRKRGLQRSTINKGFDFLQAGVSEHVIRVLPVSQDVGTEEVQQTCLEMNRGQAQCRDKWNPAIAACYVITSHPDIRYCLTEEGMNPLTLFWECAKAHCALNQDSCTLVSSDAVKKCVNITPDCNNLY